MTGLEIVGALELLRRAMSAVNGIQKEIPEFIEIFDGAKKEINDSDTEKEIEEKVRQITERVIKRGPGLPNSHRRWKG